MMKYEENPKSMYIAQDLLEQIFLSLPFKSLLRFKTVSKEWRSILESKRFVEMHLSLQKSGKTRRKVLAASHCECDGPPSILPGSRFVRDEEFIYLHCNNRRPSMSCEGLVCIPEPGWINVLNPSTRQLCRFPSGPAPVYASSDFPNRVWETNKGRWTHFPGYYSMGFGKDKVKGSYKVVRMFFDPRICEILDVDIGEWRKLSPPPYEVHLGRRSAYVNGSIYWFDIVSSESKILALDVHTEEFHDVSIPVDMGWIKMETQIVNFEDRLATVTAQLKDGDLYRKLRIWTMDAEEGTWSKTHSISIAFLAIRPFQFRLFTPVKVSMQGDVLFNDHSLRLLYKYHSLTNTISPMWPSARFALTLYLENRVRFQTTTDQLDLRQSACIRGTTCHFKDEISSGHGISSFQSSVDNNLHKEKSERAYIWLWHNQMKMLLAILFVHLMCSFCTGDQLSLPMLVWLASLDFWDIIKFIVMILVFKLVMMSSSVLIVGVSSSAFIPISVLMATRAFGS